MSDLSALEALVLVGTLRSEVTLLAAELALELLRQRAVSLQVKILTSRLASLEALDPVVSHLVANLASVQERRHDFFHRWYNHHSLSSILLCR